MIDNTLTLLDIALLKAQMAHTELIHLHELPEDSPHIRRRCRAKFVEYRKWTKEADRLRKIAERQIRSEK